MRRQALAVLILSFATLFITDGFAMALRYKRSLEDMARMVRATTGQNALDYNDYGNYCGLGGEGSPVDGIDNCCAVHDECYANLNRNQCFSYLVPYRYSIHGKSIDCFTTGDWCRDVTCRCDKQLAECVSMYPYDHQFKHLPNIRLLVQQIIR